MKVEKIDSIVNKLLSNIRNQKEEKTSKEVDKSIESSLDLGRRNIDIESVWFKIIDEKFKAHSYVYCVRGDKLIIQVDSSCYLSALKMQDIKILKRIREAGFTNIRKIEFKI
jgi:hypothetical protein